ncbi:MAG: enoyl-CoA hydratase [Hyphomicrobiales bacterium]|nr:enoyl-CoA hydratase [Hyphomicrobiales bacterium]
MTAKTAIAEMPQSPVLRAEVNRPGVLRIILANPPANTLSEAVLDAFQAAIERAAADDDIRVVVLAAEGRIFCAGHDLKQLTARRADGDGGHAYFKSVFGRSAAIMSDLRTLPKPVIAEIDGLATAAGCQLVASCDMAIASNRASFGANGVDFGLFCSTPMVALSRNVPRKVALEMLMTGEIIDVERARENGLVNRVVEPDRLGTATDKIIDRLLARPARVLALGKRAFYRQLNMDLADAYLFATQTIADNMLMDEAREGIGAFLDKRKPGREGD